MAAYTKPVYGSRDGLKECNRLLTRVEPLINVAQLRNVYLYGIRIRDERTKLELPDEVYQQYIDNAISQLEHELDISIIPNSVEEYQDYDLNNYSEWGYMQLHNVPVIEINDFNMLYSKTDANTDYPIQQLPPEWIRLEAHSGVIRLIPNNRFPAKLQISAGGSFFPEVLRQPTAPHLWKIEYKFGFAEGKIPVIVNHAIGLLAATQALIIGGNLILHPGISGTSLSIDGLSQSVQVTNRAYTVTIEQFDKLLRGPKGDGGIMKTLKDYYLGEGMNVF